MKRLLAVSLIAASISLAYAQTAPFDIVKSATVAAKEAKITCKKLAVAPKSCVIAYFDEGFELSKKPSEYYRVLDGKTADGQFVATDYYSSGQLQADAIATSNRQALLTSPSAQVLNPNAQNYTGYHKNGAKEQTVNYTNGLASGVYQRWYDNGTKEAEGTYKNDERTGAWTVWYENGTKEEEGTYKNDEPTGTWTMWHDNGTKAKEGSYNDDGERTGTWTMWHDNGTKAKEGSYNDDGELTGAWTAWHENGTKKMEGSFNDDGEQTGTWTYWDENGEVSQTVVYANGELISQDGVAVVAAEAVEAVTHDEPTLALDADAAAEDLGTRCITFKRADQCVIAFFDKNDDVQKTAKNAAFYRVLYGKVNDLFIVQDFFTNGKKQSNVDFVRSYSGILSSFDPHDLDAQGTIKGYDTKGHETFSTTFDKGEPACACEGIASEEASN